ncbi:MAG: amino-acid racemase [Marinilabiliales bacterium]|nr:MAG: amino-acid racemase [Marinilabiliales bacterium]
MATLKISITEVRNNIIKLNKYLKRNNIEWSLITKVFSGDEDFMRKVLTPDIIKDLHSVGDSRLSSLKTLKEVNPDLITIYIKPPAEIYVEDIVQYADISLNSSYRTIKALNEAAGKAGKIHKIIVMVELGELREGVLRENLEEFYEKVFELANIEVIGLGSNLGCMYGIEPTFDKLMQLTLYKMLLETKFKRKLPVISGGSSITLPLVENGRVPEGINHFRIGESAFFGTSPLDNETFKDLSSETFRFYGNIIELEEKEIVPDGVINDASIGHTEEFDQDLISETTFKAIVDFGLLDVDTNELELLDPEIQYVGTTSDMTVLDLGKNLTKDKKKKYRVGDKVCFKPSYMAVARLLNSKFIEKEFL